MAQLTINILQHVFPYDTVWSFSGSDIVGYSISKNLHFVIKDGICISRDGSYLLSIYRPSDENHYINWLPTKECYYPKKYLYDDKLIEDWINFENVQEREAYVSKIENL